VGKEEAAAHRKGCRRPEESDVPRMKAATKSRKKEEEGRGKRAVVKRSAPKKISKKEGNLDERKNVKIQEDDLLNRAETH